jgi:hypothetical protein
MTETKIQLIPNQKGTTVRQLFEQTTIKTIIDEWNEQLPDKCGKLTKKWIKKWKSLYHVPPLPKEYRCFGCMDEKQDYQPKSIKEFEMYVQNVEVTKNIIHKKYLLYLDLGLCHKPCGFSCYGVAYCRWNTILSYNVSNVDIQLYGASLLLVAIINEITFHGWEEAETINFVKRWKKQKL